MLSCLLQYSRLLTLPHPHDMHSDACSTGIGAALTQVVNGHTNDIAFFSKQLTKAETCYSATELETYAIACACKYFAVYL